MKLLETISIDELLNHGGIFVHIFETSSQPFEWLNRTKARNLDNGYYLERSGDKRMSPYYERLLKLQQEGKIEDVLDVVAKYLIQLYENKWNRLYNALVDTTYRPDENYNMEEIETPNISKTSTTNTKTKVTQTTDELSKEQGVYGFNSTSSVPSTSETGQTKTTTEGDANDNENHTSETETGNRTLTRHGNIGVTTNQQMITQEVDLREYANFTMKIMQDVDKVLCLLVY